MLLLKKLGATSIRLKLEKRTNRQTEQHVMKEGKRVLIDRRGADTIFVKIQL